MSSSGVSKNQSKPCEKCGNVWFRPRRMTIRQFDKRPNCTDSACRDRSLSKVTGRFTSTRIEMTDHGWYQRTDGVWRPPGFPEQPRIPFDYTVESIMMGYGPEVHTMESL